MTDRYHLDKLEFYITNVCNLTCSNCNRYNNFHFKGWAAWDDWADNLREWSKHVHVQKPVILGGEPLLNRDIVKWITGLQELWPDSYPVQVQSNGTRIADVPGLYDAVRAERGNWIGVSIHRPEDREELFARINKFLHGPVKFTQDAHPVGSAYQFTDVNGVTVHVWNNDNFGTTNITRTESGKFSVPRSDPAKAHAVCPYVKWKNYHWIEGKIYKCGPSKLMADFDSQFGLDLNDHERNIMHTDSGLAVQDWQLHGPNFFEHIDEPIPQCQFCLEKIEYSPVIFDSTKKNWRIQSEPQLVTQV